MDNGTARKKPGVLRDILVPIGIGVLAFIGIFFYPGSIFIHPTFDVKVDDYGQITITNTGLIQAKEVRVQLTPSDLSGLTYVSCPELTNISKINYTNISNAITHGEGPGFTFEPALEFSRMSSNLPCEIKPYFSSAGGLTKVTVTADNSPAFVWTKQSNQTISLFDFVQQVQTFSIILTIAAIIASLSRFFVRRYY